MTVAGVLFSAIVIKRLIMVHSLVEVLRGVNQSLAHEVRIGIQIGSENSMERLR